MLTKALQEDDDEARTILQLLTEVGTPSGAWVVTGVWGVGHWILASCASCAGQSQHG